MQVAALHCVMLPERMEGKFRPPYLPVLASRFLDPCQAVSSCYLGAWPNFVSAPPTVDQGGSTGTVTG